MSAPRSSSDAHRDGELARKLGREQALTEHVLDSIEEVYYVFTPAGEILRWNKRVTEVTEYADEQIAGMHPADFVPESQRDFLERKIAQVVKEGRVRFEAFLLTAEGRKIPYEFTGSLLEAGGERLICGIGRDISERKERERALRAFQDRFRSALSELPIYVYSCDDQLRYTWISSALGDTIPEEIVGQMVGAFISGAEATHFRKVHRDVLASGESRKVEFTITLEGEAHHLQAFLAPETSNDGHVSGLSGVAVDVTERRHAKEQLRRREARYRRLFEEAQEGIGISTPEGRLIDVNPAGQEILGYSKEELQEMSLQELYVDPEERQRGRKMLAEKGAVRGFETRIRRKDGEEIICRLSSTARRGPDGEIEAFQTFFQDITAQKHARESLRESEEKFRTLAEGALIGIVLIQDGSYEYVNPRFAEIFDYSPEEIVGRSAQWIAHPGDKARVRENVRRRLEGETEAIRYSFRGQRRDGKTVYLEVYGVRISYQGRPAIIGSALDVTEKRRLQREILQLQEAERRQMGRDLHDWIASQLTGVAMMLRGLKGDAEEGVVVAPGDLEEVAALVRESMGDARRLARGLNPAKLDQAGLPDALRNLAEMTDRRAGVGCRYVQEGAVESLPEDVISHLYWIAQEATTNAVKYADACQITINLVVQDAYLELTVEDDGQGFELDGQQEGLGLRSMYYRAELIGGRLSVDTAPGEGTILRCRLPVDEAGGR